MFIEVEEIKTHLRNEVAYKITQGDDSLIVESLDAAVAQTKSYLGRFDVASIFSQTGNDRNSLLVLFVKDIAIWHLINLVNAGVELDLREKRYNDAINWLEAVQSGNVTPDLPLLNSNHSGDENGTAGRLLFGSNPKKIQHF